MEPCSTPTPPPRSGGLQTTEASRVPELGSRDGERQRMPQLSSKKRRLLTTCASTIAGLFRKSSVQWTSSDAMAEVLIASRDWTIFRKGGTCVRTQPSHWLTGTSITRRLFLCYSASCFLLWIVVKRWRRAQSNVLLNRWVHAETDALQSQSKAKVSRNNTKQKPVFRTFTFARCWHWTVWPCHFTSVVRPPCLNKHVFNTFGSINVIAWNNLKQEWEQIFLIFIYLFIFHVCVVSRVIPPVATRGSQSLTNKIKRWKNKRLEINSEVGKHRRRIVQQSSSLHISHLICS